MIPIRDHRPRHPLPLISLLLIAVSVACLAVELKWSATGELGTVWQTWGLVSDRFWRSLSEVFQSGNLAAAVAWVLFSLPSLWTCLFLHASFSQILGNLLFLWVFAPRLESLWGRFWFLAFYLGCGGLTSVLQMMVDPSASTPLIGANGAIAAILGAYLVLFPTVKIDTLFLWGMGFGSTQLPAWCYGIWWFVQQVFYGIGGLSAAEPVNSWNVGYWAHGLGLLVGGGLALLATHPSSISSSEEQS